MSRCPHGPGYGEDYCDCWLCAQEGPPPERSLVLGIIGWSLTAAVVIGILWDWLS